MTVDQWLNVILGVAAVILAVYSQYQLFHKSLGHIIGDVLLVVVRNAQAHMAQVTDEAIIEQARFVFAGIKKILPLQVASWLIVFVSEEQFCAWCLNAWRNVQQRQLELKAAS
jgi:hypothetical protein